MKYCPDASVAMKWVLPEPDTSRAVRIRNEFRVGLLELIAPDVFVPEVSHGLTKAERRGVIPVGMAERRMLNVINCLPDLYPPLPLVRRAIQIASRARIAVYDCLCLALAEREGSELLTADDKLVRNLQPQFPFIMSLASMP